MKSFIKLSLIVLMATAVTHCGGDADSLSSDFSSNGDERELILSSCGPIDQYASNINAYLNSINIAHSPVTYSVSQGQCKLSFKFLMNIVSMWPLGSSSLLSHAILPTIKNIGPDPATLEYTDLGVVPCGSTNCRQVNFSLAPLDGLFSYKSDNNVAITYVIRHIEAKSKTGTAVE